MNTTVKLSIIEYGVHAPQHAGVFKAARVRHPALAEHESIDSVLAVLADMSRGRNMEKDAITRALVAETQETQHPFWPVLLLLAYWPMVCRLSGRIRSSERDPSERLQLVVAAFIEVISSIPPQRPWICMSLRRRTERKVFQHLGRERRQRRVIGSIEALEPQQHEAALARLFHSGVAWPPTRPEAAGEGLEPDEQNACVAYLREHAEHVLDDEELALVTATLVLGQRLTDYVREHHQHLDDIARQHLYQRLKRRHSRAMTKLRDALATRWERLKTAKAEADAWPWPRSVAASR
jgi:hypothetical protein